MKDSCILRHYIVILRFCFPIELNRCCYYQSTVEKCVTHNCFLATLWPLIVNRSLGDVPAQKMNVFLHTNKVPGHLDRVLQKLQVAPGLLHCLCRLKAKGATGLLSLIHIPFITHTVNSGHLYVLHTISIVSFWIQHLNLNRIMVKST